MELWGDSAATGRNKNKSAYWKVINEIMDGIRSHEYKPGDRIPSEPELMERTQLSRGSVREAIKILSALGIIVIRRGEGTFIAQADEMPMFDSIAYILLMYNTPLEEVLEFRFHIDDMVLRMVVDKVSEDNIQELEEIIEKAEEAYKAKDIDLVNKLDVHFHMRIVDFTQNYYIKRTVGGIYEFIIPEIINRNPNNQEFYESAAYSHADIVKFLRTKDYSILDKSNRYGRSKVWYQYPGVIEKK